MSLLSQFFPSGGGGSSEGALNVTGFSIDFLLVGGGGGGGSLNPCAFPAACLTPSPLSCYHPATATGGGGGGGRAFQIMGANVVTDVEYPIVIGAGGAADSDGSESRFGDFIAGGGGRGGGDPNKGIASYYFKQRNNIIGHAGSDAFYMDCTFRCMTDPSYDPLVPCYSYCVFNNRYSGEDSTLDTCNGVAIGDSYLRCRSILEQVVPTVGSGNLRHPSTLSAPCTVPCFAPFCMGCTSLESPGIGYPYNNGSVLGLTCGIVCWTSGYRSPSCVCFNSSLQIYNVCNAINDIFKRNNIDEFTSCKFGQGGGGGSVIYGWKDGAVRLQCSTDHSVWAEKLLDPAKSGSLPKFPAFNRDKVALCERYYSGVRDNVYLNLLGLERTSKCAQGAHGEFLPISNQRMRFAMSSGFYNSAYIFCVCSANNCIGRSAQGGLVDTGPRAGEEYFPLRYCPQQIDAYYAGTCNLYLQKSSVSDTIDEHFYSANNPGVVSCPSWLCRFSCAPSGGCNMFNSASSEHAYTPYSYLINCCGNTRIFTCCQCGLKSWAQYSPNMPSGSCFCGPLYAPASSQIICDLIQNGTPHIQCICWKPAESAIAGTGSGGGGGMRGQGYCNSNNNVFFKYLVTYSCFNPSSFPIGPNYIAYWQANFGGGVISPLCWPQAFAPAANPWGVNCLQICIPCTPPATLSGGQGGSGSLWIVYPSELPEATVTGNTPVSSPPTHRVYYWEGNGTIKFNS